MKLLALAGRVADAARNIVGGYGLNGYVKPVSIMQSQAAMEHLLKVLDDYDETILELARSKES